MPISDRLNITASAAAFLLMIGVLSGCNKGTDTAESASTETTTSSTEAASAEQVLPVVKVEKRRLDTQLELPGNLEAYQDVPLHAKVEGYISWIGVDRGSFVKTGQPLITVTAPELDAKTKEAFAKVSSAKSAYQQAIAALESVISRQVEAKAKLDSDQLTLKRLKEAGLTPGAVAQNDIDMAQKTVEGDSARVKSLSSEIEAARNLVASEKNNIVAARSTYDAVRAMEAYLTIRAPFDGVITERNVHKGSIVAVTGSRESTPLLRIEQKNILRLVLAVPEASVSG
ncbi:MAG: efflux RND transporter periplasmic adaptor subunit, partial [Terriglobales bacterium]